jgi:hypothetical protein
MVTDLIRNVFAVSTDKQQTFPKVTGKYISGRTEKNAWGHNRATLLLRDIITET